MSEKALSWENLAHILASRLTYQDFCENGHDTIKEGIDDGCPNCDDREAMRQYRLKAPPSPRPARQRTITIEELRGQPAPTKSEEKR